MHRIDVVRHRAAYWQARALMALRPYTNRGVQDVWLAGYRTRCEEELEEKIVAGRTFPRPPAPGSGPLPTPDPVSFAVEPIGADEIAVTDPEHVARTLNVYAKVLADHDLSGAVQEWADLVP